MKLKKFKGDNRLIEEDCDCNACKGKYTRSALYCMINCDSSGIGAQLITHHNVAHMLRLVRTFRKAIIEGNFQEVISRFLIAHFGTVEQIPGWVTDALAAVGMKVVAN